MNTPRLNRLLFSLYTLISVGVFIGALVSPPVRAVAPAPLRDWVGAQATNIGNLFGTIRIPNFFAGTVAIEVSSSNTKEDWMNATAAKFNQAQVTTSSGSIINVTVKHVTSGGSQQAILDGKSQPTVWSPGDGSWVDSANVAWKDRTGRPLISQPCAPTVYAPIGFTMWKPMAEALGWPDKPISWNDIAALSANPKGWASVGHPEWGQFKFGHTHPTYSNVGCKFWRSADPIICTPSPAAKPKPSRPTPSMPRRCASLWYSSSPLKERIGVSNPTASLMQLGSATSKGKPPKHSATSSLPPNNKNWQSLIICARSVPTSHCVIHSR
ncbi:MAG: substrate-binding domain-containing protein [Chloroflexi bacterium]|nr:substrate-binding domain-containing protein [Chloroflexota bacterium]